MCVRWPGSFGSALLYFVVPKAILFREQHSARVLVDRVDFMSAPGPHDDTSRRDGPVALLTSKALFHFSRSRRRFALMSVHRGQTTEGIRSLAGFAYDEKMQTPLTDSPDATTLELLRGRVAAELAETYPRFAALLIAERVALCGRTR